MQLRSFFCSALLVLPLRSLPAQTPTEAAVAMVEAEKRFFQTGQVQGTRAAFLAFLADDGIIFRPGPVNGKEVWTKREETGLDLVWEPNFAVVARSGDFGYDTGPSKWRTSRKEEKFSGHGYFISVWKKQKDESWKVALDCGIENPEPTGRMKQMIYGELDAPTKSIPPEVLTKGLAEAQHGFYESAKVDADAALREFGAEKIRFYRNGHFPSEIFKEATIRLRSGEKTSFEPLGGDMSSSADLAYAYGKYSGVGEKAPEQGHYLHIWQTDKVGAWKLVLDWQQAAPKSE